MATPEQIQEARKTLEAKWRKDKYGWPIETVKDHLIKSWVRILCQNIRKITG